MAFDLRKLAVLPASLLAACAMQRPAPPAPPAPLPRSTVSMPPPVTVTVPSPASLPPPVPLPAPAGITLQDWAALHNRLYRIVAPLLLDNTELCAQHVRNLLGLTAKTRHSYSADYAAEAQTVLGLDDRLRVMNVLPGSGAAAAGILPGDVLLTVEIEPLPQGPAAERDGVALIAAEMQGRTSLNLTVERNGQPLAFSVPLTSACGMTVDVGNADFINSYADGQRVLVTRGMIAFTQSDDELAYVLAREIAHNLLAPQPRPQVATIIDRLRRFGRTPLPDAGSDAPPYTIAADVNADRLALYLLLRAGYRIDGAPAFWARLAQASPQHTALHPQTAVRQAAIEQTMRELQAKVQGSLPLVP